MVAAIIMFLVDVLSVMEFALLDRRLITFTIGAIWIGALALADWGVWYLMVH